MDKSTKLLIGLWVFVFIVFIGVNIHPNKVDANPSGFYQSFIGTTPTFNGITGNAGNVATTSLAYMTPGTATSTVYWDSQLGGASAMGSESAALEIGFSGSSTVSTLQVNQEFSQGTPGVNCVATPLACDWYEGTQGMLSIGVATSTNNPKIFDIAIVPQYSFLFASSTVGGVALGSISSTSPATRIIPVFTPTRYTRFVFSLKPVANGNGAVWANVVAKKQNP